MTNARLRMGHGVVKLLALGPRPLLELLTEIGERNGCLEDIAARLEQYGRLDPAVIRELGADRLEQCRPRLVG